MNMCSNYYLSRILVTVLLSFSVMLSAQDITINEVMASNSRTLQDNDGRFPDWIELFNKTSTTIDLAGYSITDNKKEPRKYVFPSFTMSPSEFLVVYAAGDSATATILFWNTLVSSGDTWRYLLPSSEPPAAWRGPGYDDSSWSSGPGGIGYGDNDDATLTAATLSVYMRKRFQLSGAADAGDALFQIDYDDAFVAYLNGTEIARSNIGTAGIPPAYNSPSDGLHEATMYNGGQPESYTIGNINELLREGENVLAVQVHNQSASSSDLSSIPYLSVQLTGKPASPPPSELGLTVNDIYTGFKIDADGDTLYLYKPSGELADSAVITPQSTDISFGRKPDGTGPWYIFTNPTPGSANTSAGFDSYTPDEPVYSLPGGFYSTAITLGLSSDNPGDTIYYSTDGSEPGPGSDIYTGPLEISESVVIRARIIKAGFLPGRMATSTYITGRKPDLPVISVTTDPYNLWDNEYGIYVKGDNAEEESPFLGANFWQDWERPAHIEMYETDGTQAFSIDAGIKIFGNYSRSNPQKSLAVYARKMYGDKEINYKIFPDKPIEKFESIVLRNAGNDWFGAYSGSGSMMRDLITTSLSKNLNQDVQSNRQAVVFLNGEYWGIQNIREKVNEHYIESNHGVDADNINLLEGNAWVVQGTNQNYTSMISYIQAHDMSLDASYEYVSSKMDIDNYMKYVIANIFVFNGDWPGNNIKFWEPSDGTGKWRWIMFDTDFGFGIWDPNKVYDNTFAFALAENGEGWPNPPWSTYLLRSLMQNETFRNDFINTFADLLNTTFSAENVVSEIKSLKDNIDDEIVYHLEKWGAPAGEWGSSVQQWINVIDQITTFAIKRPVIITSQIEQMFAAGSSQQLRISIVTPEGGHVRVNSIMPDKFPWSGSYFSNIPIHITSITEPGYRFTGWTGASSDTLPSIDLVLASPQNLYAHFEKIPGASENPVVINEINYKSSPDSDSKDWVELYNHTTTQTDVSGWVLSDDTDDHQFVIAPGTVMDSGTYLVLCRDTASFSDIYPEVKTIQGDLGFGLSSSGEYVRLYTSTMRLEDSVFYDVSAPWPSAPNGSGYTLSLLSPGADNLLAENWASSRHPGGSPGSENFPKETEGIDLPPLAADIMIQCYPNPFSQTLGVSLLLNKHQQITISVYDLNGRKTAVIAKGMMSSGKHVFTWDASWLSSGIYIIRLETENS
ncbi:MAG TPA: CotH kinase family protein, partial [Bacteroidales bacterium]|nr:CotH kinase family protein [Bacteroidales bacterium]